MEPTWLVDFGVWVDELIGDRRIAARFWEMLLEIGRRDVRILNKPNKGKNPSSQDQEFPPRRGMRLAEKYLFVSAVHDAVCEGTKCIWRQLCRGKTFARADDTAATYAAIAVKRDADNKVPELRLEHFQRIRGIFADVAKDLDVEPPQVQEPAVSHSPPEHTVIAVDARRQTNIVTVGTAGNGKPNRTTPKKPGGRAQRPDAGGKLKSEANREIVLAFLDKCGVWDGRLKDLSEALKKKTGLKVSPSTLSRYLKGTKHDRHGKPRRAAKGKGQREAVAEDEGPADLSHVQTWTMPDDAEDSIS